MYVTWSSLLIAMTYWVLQNASNNAADMISKFSIIYNRTRRRSSSPHVPDTLLTTLQKPSSLENWWR